jgi:hypothetical protein
MERNPGDIQKREEGKAMTERDIIKASECCVDMACSLCPLQTYSAGPNACRRKCKSELLRLVKKKDDDIERLERMCAVYEEETGLQKKVSNALKVFFNKAVSKAYESSDWSHGEHPYVVDLDDLESIYAEMVGEEDDR